MGRDAGEAFDDDAGKPSALRDNKSVALVAKLPRKRRRVSFTKEYYMETPLELQHFQEAGKLPESEKSPRDSLAGPCPYLRFQI